MVHGFRKKGVFLKLLPSMDFGKGARGEKVKGAGSKWGKCERSREQGPPP